MTCYRPIKAYQETVGGEVTLLPYGVKNTQGHIPNLALPCGRCIGCRASHASQWALRCEHEAKLTQHNIFLTLTYDDEHLPENNYLETAHLQNFIKRIRKSRDTNPTNYLSDPARNIRYFAAGEYGRINGRPHYHLLIFNIDLQDKQKTGGTTGRPDTILYESETIKQLWPFGQHKFGIATPASANYIAQYNLKKQGAGDHDADGVYRPAPFLLMSRKPPIGADWLTQYATDLRKGYLTNQGTPRAIPRAYMKRLKKTQPDLFEEIQLTKYQNIDIHSDKGTPERLRDAEIIHTHQKHQSENRNL